MSVCGIAVGGYAIDKSRNKESERSTENERDRKR